MLDHEGIKGHFFLFAQETHIHLNVSLRHLSNLIFQYDRFSASESFLLECEFTSRRRIQSKIQYRSIYIYIVHRWIRSFLKDIYICIYIYTCDWVLVVTQAHWDAERTRHQENMARLQQLRMAMRERMEANVNRWPNRRKAQMLKRAEEARAKQWLRLIYLGQSILQWQHHYRVKTAALYYRPSFASTFASS